MKKIYKKKILIIGSKERFSLENMYLRAFSELGQKVYSYHAYDIRKNFFFRFLWKYFKSLIFFYLRVKLLKFLNKNKNKYDLIIIFKGLFLSKNFFLKLKKTQQNSKWINIFPDDPFNTNKFEDISNNNVLESIVFFDFFFTYSQSLLKKLKKKYSLKKIFYLPFAYDDSYHKKNNKVECKKFDLCFIGTADQKRYKFLNKLNEFKILLAGDGWQKYKIPKNISYVGHADVNKFSKMVSISKISLNILRNQNEKSHNMKTFEIPAMGGVLLTKRSHEQNFFLPENIASLMYGSIFELKQKINFAQKNPKKILKIKKNAKKYIQNHTYKNRSLFILKTVFYE